MRKTAKHIVSVSAQFKSCLMALLAVATLSLGLARSQAQAVVTVDPNNLNWIGYINVFYLPADGGAYLTGFAQATADLRAVFGATNLTLSVNTNQWATYSDGANPLAIMDASFYIENNNLLNTNIVFGGVCVSSSLTANPPEPTAGYTNTSVAFIKVFDSGYVLLGSVTTNLVGGQAFSITMNTALANAAHAQYGFETMAPVANPANPPSGTVVIQNATPAKVVPPTVVVTIDPSQAWQGYMNWFQLDGTTHVGGSSWGLAALQSSLTSSNLTVSPCTNVWNPTDIYWVQADGITPNKVMDASFYVQTSYPAATTNVIFNGTCLSNTLTANPEPLTGIHYTSVAFIKNFDVNYNLIGNVASPVLTAGQSFSINLSPSGAAHVQYGIETIGPDASPATVASLGNVVWAAALPGVTSPTITASLSAGSVNLSFPTVMGFNYTVQYKTDLTDAAWQTLGSVLPGNNAIQTVTDPTAQTHRFYRLSIQ